MTRGLGILALGMVLTGMAGLAWADNYSTRVLADNPYGYWRLDESGGLTAVNLGSGGAAINGNYGQFSPPDGIPTLGVPGIPGAPTDTAAGFHGTAPVSQVYVPDAVNPSAYSLESWVKANPGATTGRNIMVRTAGNPTTTYSHQLLILGDGRLRHYGYSSTGGKWLDSASPVQANQWYHVVGTASQGTGPTDGHWTLYVNGHLQNEWFGDVGTLWNGGTQWRIGSVAGGGADWLDGTIDETALYHDELGPRQIRQHYMAGMGISPVYENPSRRMTAGDFDNDGVNEVAYIGSTNHIWVQDFNNPAASGVLPGPTVRALTAADLDGNGVPEIAFIDASANQLRSYNAVTGTLTTHSLPAGYTAFSTLSAGDVDGQVGHELMLSANADQLFIYENGTYVDTGGQANRIARGEVVQGTAGDDFLVISAGGDP